MTVQHTIFVLADIVKTDAPDLPEAMGLYTAAVIAVHQDVIVPLEFAQRFKDRVNSALAGFADLESEHQWKLF